VASVELVTLKLTGSQYNFCRQDARKEFPEERLPSAGRQTQNWSELCHYPCKPQPTLCGGRSTR
jgi:hypothetical protein